MNACRTLGIPSVAVYSDADVTSKHRRYADESVHIGAAPPRESYLDIEKIISAAKDSGADAIHPGYGFLAENPLLPKRCAEEGIVFIGPSPDAMRLLGNKVESRIKMAEAGVPLVPGMQGDRYRAIGVYRSRREGRIPGYGQGRRRGRGQGHAGWCIVLLICPRL